MKKGKKQEEEDSVKRDEDLKARQYNIDYVDELVKRWDNKYFR